MMITYRIFINLFYYLKYRIFSFFKWDLNNLRFLSGHLYNKVINNINGQFNT